MEVYLAPKTPKPPTAWIDQILKETYRIDQLIGEGGTGLVFLGFHLRLKVQVAIKILKQSAGEVAFARFRKEAEITARLRHPNIVHILDYDVTDEGCAYIVTEWLEGETLSSFMKRNGAITASAAIAILKPVCDAVAAAHVAGVVHRDLKPANLFLSRATGHTDQPLIKVLDFGIAKLTALDPVRTEQGQTVGTPRYMSPEQIRIEGESEIGPASDQFSLGSIAYELVAGRPAFPGSAHAAMLAILEGSPAPLDESVPSAYRSAVARAMKQRPEDRFPAVSDFFTSLKGEVPIVPPEERPALPISILLSGVGLALVLLLLVVWLNRGPQLTRLPPIDTRGQAASGAAPMDTAAPSGGAQTVTALPEHKRPRMLVRVQVIPRSAYLLVNGHQTHGHSVELPIGEPVQLKVVAGSPDMRRCCPAREITYVPSPERKPPVIELRCDKDCPIF